MTLFQSMFKGFCRLVDLVESIDPDSVSGLSLVYKLFDVDQMMGQARFKRINN